MASLPEPLEECTYTYLVEGIHELTFRMPSEQALRQCFAYLDTIFSQAPTDQPLLLLSDIRQSGVPPAMPMWGLASSLRQNHPQRPLTYNAIVYPRGRISSFFILVMEQLAVLYQARIRFVAEEYETAKQWLLQSKGKR